VKKRCFSQFLTLLFLFTFSFEVITGLTINPGSESHGFLLSSKSTSLHFSDFLWEEFNESEEETGDINHAIANHSAGFNLIRFFFFDFTKLFSQYHAELLRSRCTIPIYRLAHIWLI
jgi:hypothetical protein